MLLRLLMSRPRSDTSVPRGRRHESGGRGRDRHHRRAGHRRRRLRGGDGARGHVVDLGDEWRRVTGLPFVYALWAAPRRGHRRRGCRAAAAQPERGPGAPARDRVGLGRGPRRRAGAVRALPDRQHPLPPGRRRAVGPGRLLRSDARRGRRCPACRARASSGARPPAPRCCPMTPQPGGPRHAAGHSPSPSSSPSSSTTTPSPSQGRSIDALLSDARRRRAAVARRRHPPLRAGDGARPSAPPPTRAAARCTRGGRHLHHRFATSTTPTSASPDASSATSTGRRPAKRATRSRARCWRRSSRETVDLGGVQNPAAGRAQPEPAAHLVRGSLSLDEEQLPAGDSTACLPRGDPLHRRESRTCRFRAVVERLIAAGPGFDPGRRRRDPRRRDPPPDLARSSAPPTPGWEVMRQGHALGLRTPPPPWSLASANGPAPHHEPPGAAARAAGPDRRVHRVHLLALPGRGGRASKLHGRHHRPCATCACSRWRACTWTTSPASRSPGRRWGPEVGQVALRFGGQRLRLGR